MKTAFYKFDVELEKLLTASCTKPEDAQVVREIFEDDLGVDQLGVGANRQDDGIHFAFPIVVVAGAGNQQDIEEVTANDHDWHGAFTSIRRAIQEDRSSHSFADRSPS